MNYTGYRIQGHNRNIADLTNPATQQSHTIHMDDDTTRTGVSACETLPELAAYWATSGVEIGNATPVLIKLEGPLSDDEPLDSDRGEILMLPTTATLIEDDEAFFELVGDLWEMALMEGLDYDDLVTIAEERI